MNPKDENRRIEMNPKDENWFRGQAAAKKHYDRFGLYFIDTPKSEFGKGFNECMMYFDLGWISAESGHQVLWRYWPKGHGKKYAGQAYNSIANTIKSIEEE